MSRGLRIVWGLFWAAGLLASVCPAEVVDVTDPNHPVALTPSSQQPGTPTAAPAAAPTPALTAAPTALPAVARPARAARPAQLEGNLVKKKLVIGGPAGPQTQTVAEALQIVRAGKVIRTIRTPMFIREWHFVANRAQVEVCSGPPHGPGVYQLYDIASGRTLKTARDPLDAKASSWAKK